MTTAAQSVSSAESGQSARAPLALLAAPLIVGVTGHRDLIPNQVASLETAVREVFAKLARRCGNMRIILLSQLAQRADQLVARVAAEMGIAVLAVLPMPHDLYRDDFSTPDALRSFEDVLSLCAGVIEREAPGVSAPAGAGQADSARAACYAAAGAWAVRHCHLLLALWDGAPPAATGGTAEVVRYMLSGASLSLRPGDSALDAPRVGPVIHIVTPRTKNPTPAAEPFSVHWLYPAASTAFGKRTFNACLRQTAQFNLDLHLTPNSTPSIPADSLSIIRQRLHIVDAMALRMRRRSTHAVRLTMLLGLLAVACRALSSDKNAGQPIYFAAFAICFAAAATVFAITRYRQWHRRFLDYRSLAEALRVAYFWRLADVSWNVHECYLRRQRDELSWLHLLMTSWALTDQTLPRQPAANLSDRLKTIRHHWVRDQIRFYMSRAIIRKAQASRLRIMEVVLIIFGLLQTGASLVLHTRLGDKRNLADAHRALIGASAPWLGLGYIALFGLGAAAMAWTIHLLVVRRRRNRSPWSIAWQTALLVCGTIAAGGALYLAATSAPPVRDMFRAVSDSLAIIAPIAAATIHAYGWHWAFDQEARHYARMQQMFRSADAALRVCLENDNFQDAQALIEELGRESLAKNGDWLITHRERPVTLPMS